MYYSYNRHTNALSTRNDLVQLNTGHLWNAYALRFIRGHTCKFIITPHAVCSYLYNRDIICLGYLCRTRRRSYF